MARPRAPPAQHTSTSTVGLPRLSSTSRAKTAAITSRFPTRRLDSGEFVFAHFQHVGPAGRPLPQHAAGDAADGLALRLLGQVIDRAGAVDPRQGAGREVA